MCRSSQVLQSIGQLQDVMVIGAHPNCQHKQRQGSRREKYCCEQIWPLRHLNVPCFCCNCCATCTWECMLAVTLLRTHISQPGSRPVTPVRSMFRQGIGKWANKRPCLNLCDIVELLPVKKASKAAAPAPVNFRGSGTNCMSAVLGSACSQTYSSPPAAEDHLLWTYHLLVRLG